MNRCWLAIVAAVGLSASFVSAHPDDGESIDPSDGAAEAEEAGVPESTPEQRQEAAARFSKGLEFYRQGDFELALVEFDRAYTTIPDYRVLYNIGQVCVQLGRYARAQSALQKYLDDGGEAIVADRVEAVRADLDMLEERTAFLAVSTNVEGASVLIDGTPVGQTPLAAPLVLDAGEHEVEMRRPGYSGVPKRVTLAGGDRLEVRLELTPVARPAPAPPPSDPDPDPEPVPVPARPPMPPDLGAKDRSSTNLWIGWSTTAALGVGAGTTFGFALSAKNELEELRGTLGVTKDRINDQKRKAETLFAVTDALTAASVVAGGVSLYLTLRQRHPKSPHAATRGPVQVGVEVGLREVVVVGLF